jgi:PPM family protein phosphatase
MLPSASTEPLSTTARRASPPRVAAAAAMHTDRGRVRPRNEDAALLGTNVFAVADGVGGNHAGDVAARIATAVLSARAAHATGALQLRAATLDAHRAVARAGAADPALAGMATTLTAMLLCEDRVAVAHVGDSRAYRLRNGRLERMTADHTAAEWLAARGRVRVEAWQHTLVRALGGTGGDRPDVGVHDARPGDAWLLCSDGLTDQVPESRLLASFQRAPSLPDATRALVALANEAGGRDNVTVVAALLR